MAGELPFGWVPSGELTAYTPTLRERAADWLRPMLFSDDRAGQDKANRLVNWGETMIPPFGFATSAYDAGRAGGEGDYLTAGTLGAMALAPGSKIKAFHASPFEFDEIKPSNYRGASFFASTPNRAKAGASAGANEMVMDTATVLPARELNVYQAEIDPFKIHGLALTPSEFDWFKQLPDTVVGDDQLSAVIDKTIPYGMYWDDFYDARQIDESTFEYVKKAEPPTLSYEEAIQGGRNIYHKQWPHYGLGADEKKAAENVIRSGMGGYLVQDEGGLSIAVADPSIIKSLSRQ